MKTICAAALVAAWAAAAHAAGDAIGVITSIEGKVTIRHQDGAVVESAKLMDNVFPSDVVETNAAGRVKILFEGDILVLLGPNSSALIREHVFVRRDGLRRLIIFLKRGMIRSILERIYPGATTMNVESPNSVAGVVGTDFAVEYDEGGERTLTAVLRGEVEVKSAFVGGARLLRENQFTETVGKETAPAEPRAIPGDMKARLSALMMADLLPGGPKPIPGAEGGAAGGRVPAQGIANTQVNVVGQQPIFIGGGFGSPNVPAAVPPKPAPGGGGGPSPSRPGRVTDIGEYLGGRGR